MKSKSPTIRFLYAASESSADMLYLSGVFVPDPFLAIIHGKKKFALINKLEYGRMRKESNFDEIVLLETIRKKAAEKLNIASNDVGPSELMIYFIEKFEARKIQVPADFPAIYYSQLCQAGYRVEILEGAFFPKRSIKTDEQARAIKQGNAASAAGIRAAEYALRNSTIEGNRIIYKGKTLTSERLRTVIDLACLRKGAVAKHTIVAGGIQACDPHEVGYGPLRPHKLIIIDVFPRVQKTGYHGDLTRTFLKGFASPAQRTLVKIVQAAQRSAMQSVAAGVKGDDVHRTAQQVFDEAGYLNERNKNGFAGFIHSTGHGLGLEVHEAPRVALGASNLKAGQVITIEPGLYYPQIGSCRIEDVVRVTKTGYEMLSSFHYRWEIR